MKRPAFLIAALALVLWTTVPPALAGQVRVFAAASLTDAVGAMQAAFQKLNPGDTIVPTFAASGQLLSGILGGQPCDVFLSADTATMDAALDKKAVVPASRTVFAGNSLVLAVPSGNPAGITGLDSLSAGGVRRIGVGNPETVPAGRYTKRALQHNALWFALTSKLVYYVSVRHVLSALGKRELDAGFVYATDAAIAAKDVSVAATIPLSPPVTYAAALTEMPANPDGAKRFLAFLGSPEARAVLARFGFTAP